MGYGGWQRMAPGELRGVVERAWREGRLDALLSDPELLVGADPDVLLPLIEYAGHHDSRPDSFYAVACRAHRYVFAESGPEVRRWLLAVHAARLKTPDLVPPPGPWRVLWAGPVQWNRHVMGLSEGMTGRAVALATGRLRGRVTAAVGYEGGAVRLWDAATGTPRVESAPLPSWPWEDAGNALALGEVDGRPVVAVACGTGVWLWEPESGRCERLGAMGGVAAIRIAVVNRRPVLVMAAPGLLRVWDLRRRRPVHGMRLVCDIDGRTLAVSSVRGRPVAVAGGERGAVHVWDLRSGTPLGTPLSGHEGPVTGLATASVDGRPVALSGGRDGRVRLWGLAESREYGLPLVGHRGAVTGLATARVDGRAVIVSGGWDGTVRLWDMRSGRQLGTPLMTASGSVWGVAAVSVAGRSLAFTGAHGPVGLGLWDLAYREPRRPAPARRDPVICLAAARVNGDAVVVGFNRSRRSPDFGSRAAATGEPVHGFAVGRRPDTIGAVATGSTDGRAVAVTGDTEGVVRVWGTAPDKSLPGPLRGHVGRVRAVAVGEVNGRDIAASAGDDGTVRLWNLHNGQPCGPPMTGHTGPVTTIQIHRADGHTTIISGGDDGTLRLWNPETQEALVQPLRGHTGRVRAVAVGEVNGREIAASAGDDGTVRLWNLHNGQPCGPPMTGHTGP
ncbi:WD40 repeat domain-containing protein, partial [Streptomyces sp. NPDC020875]|uniref:WD40 repeat domain-containing protein n=1 Tax=Streptomyces sp. NPDC020875 TaxID=3154898 RepID=UPI0033C66B90